MTLAEYLALIVVIAIGTALGLFLADAIEQELAARFGDDDDAGY